MKRAIFFTIALCVLSVSPLTSAGVSLDVAPVDEWELTSSSATFTIDFLGDTGESGLFYVQIKEGDPGVFMDISVEPAAGNLGLIMTALVPDYAPAGVSTSYDTTYSYYKTYVINVEDSQGNLPGGLLAQLTFYQEGCGSSLIRAFKDPDDETPVASLLIAIVDFPGGNIVVPPNDTDIPIPGNGDGEEVPEPATLLMLGCGGWALMRKRKHI